MIESTEIRPVFGEDDTGCRDGGGSPCEESIGLVDDECSGLGSYTGEGGKVRLLVVHETSESNGDGIDQ